MLELRCFFDRWESEQWDLSYIRTGNLQEIGDEKTYPNIGTVPGRHHATHHQTPLSGRFS